MSAARILTTAGFVLGTLALVSGLLPGEIPPSVHVARHGRVWLGGPIAAFLLPVAAAVTDALLRGLCLRYPVSGAAPPTVLPIYDAMMLRCTACVVGVHAMVLAALCGLLEGRAWAAPVVPLMLGSTLVGVGNLCPRLKPNVAIGIPTQTTLADSRTWLRVHRGVGYIITACGVLTIGGGVVIAAPIGPRMILVAGPIALVVGGLVVRQVAHVEPRPF